MFALADFHSTCKSIFAIRLQLIADHTILHVCCIYHSNVRFLSQLHTYVIVAIIHSNNVCFCGYVAYFSTGIHFV